MRLVASLGAKTLVILIVIVLALVGITIAALETSGVKNQLRALIVRQANQYLTAELEIGRLQGSLLRGIELGDVRLSRNGEALISIDEVALNYSMRELWQHGVVIQRIRLTRPRIVA